MPHGHTRAHNSRFINILKALRITKRNLLDICFTLFLLPQNPMNSSCEWLRKNNQYASGNVALSWSSSNDSVVHCKDLCYQTVLEFLSHVRMSLIPRTVLWGPCLIVNLIMNPGGLPAGRLASTSENESWLLPCSHLSSSAWPFSLSLTFGLLKARQGRSRPTARPLLCCWLPRLGSGSPSVLAPSGPSRSGPRRSVHPEALVLDGAYSFTPWTRIPGPLKWGRLDAGTGAPAGPQTDAGPTSQSFCSNDSEVARDPARNQAGPIWKNRGLLGVKGEGDWNSIVHRQLYFI